MRKIFLLILLVAFSLPAAIYAQGCMEASSDEGVNVVGYLQSQFAYQFNEDDDTNSFTFNRARMGLVGNIPYDFSYYIRWIYHLFPLGTFCQCFSGSVQISIQSGIEHTLPGIAHY